MTRASAWELESVADRAADTLRSLAQRRDEEQSPFGLDAPDELALHVQLAEGFARLGVGVLREQRYPAARATRRRSEGERCDIVLTPTPGDTIADPHDPPGLFGSDPIDSSLALWIEVKVARQFALIEGVARPNRGYAQQLTQGALGDVRKLSEEPAITHGALLLILFTENEDVARHDIDVWANRCLTRDLEIDPPIVRAFAVTDRIGNECCSVALTGCP